MTNEASKLVLDTKQLTEKPSTPAETKAEIFVNKMPKFEVDTGTDWAVICGSAVTIVVVLITSYMSFKNFLKSINSQEKIAKETRNGEDLRAKISGDLEKEKFRSEFISTNRQNWINTLRETLSEYVSAVLAVSDLHSMSKGTQTLRGTQPHATQAALSIEWCYRMHEAKSLALKLKTKIHLLANPTEAGFQALLPIIDDLYEKSVVLEGAGLEPDAKLLVEKSQFILKEEWERVKKLEGLV